jgi:hypothetical protein
VFESIRSRDIEGFQGIDLLRREVGAEVEFPTITGFTSLDTVRSFAGQDHEILESSDDGSSASDVMDDRKAPPLVLLQE